MSPPRCAGERDGARHLPPLPGRPWCFACDPEKAIERRERASSAGKASHARRADPAVTMWADTITARLKTPADAREIAAEALALTANGGLSTSQATAIERLLSAWLKAHRAEPTPAEAAPLTVVIPDYRQPPNGEAS